MRVFAIGDLHLAGGTGKTMDRFGENWRNHDVKVFEAWERTVDGDDVVLIVGDTSWAMRLEEARPDLDRVGRMKGRKLLLKGNHDYWWETRAKLEKALDPSIEIVNASSTIIDRIAVAGTRGWVCPNDSYFAEEDARIYEREVGRLKTALASLRGRETEYDALIIAMHYPPTNDKHEPSGFTELIDEYGAAVCVYGHMHGEHIRGALTGLRSQTVYRLVSADAVDFAPALIEIRI
jgi:predicted phosphohydrolase